MDNHSTGLRNSSPMDPYSEERHEYRANQILPALAVNIEPIGVYEANSFRGDTHRNFNNSLYRNFQQASLAAYTDQEPLRL